LARELLSAATTDACLDLLDRERLCRPVLDSLLTAIDGHLARRCGPQLRAGAVIFTNQQGLLGLTNTAKEILDTWNPKD
jgi:cobalt-precorrin-5B (C1)-methyltransferase